MGLPISRIPNFAYLVLILPQVRVRGLSGGPGYLPERAGQAEEQQAGAGACVRTRLFSIYFSEQKMFFESFINILKIQIYAFDK